MSRAPRQDRRLTKVLNALHAHGGRGRSPLYRWLRRHHDALAAAFAETPPAWEALAAELARTGLADARGNPPNADSARQTWYRVRRDVTRARAKPAPVPSPGEIAPGVRTAAAPPARAIAAAEPGNIVPVLAPASRPPLDIRPARASTSTPPAPASVQPVPQPVVTSSSEAPQVPGPSSETVEQQLQRVFAAMDSRKIPMPKVM